MDRKQLFDVYALNDVTITKGEGSFVWDEKGQRYLDMYGGHAVISIGHSHPHWKAKIKEQLDNIAFYSNSVHIPGQQELARNICNLSGHADYKLFLVNSGAEANENAIKLASFHTGRSKVLAFSKSFHGRTSLAVAATDNPSISAPVNKTDFIHFIPFNDEEKLKAYFIEQGKETAAVIIETIQGVGGIIEAPAEFLKTLRQLCDEYGTVLIADEVQCGYGRTGKFFAFDHSGCKADIYTMAKGMGNGFPIGGILISPQFKARHGLLGTTFGGSHLACAAAIAVTEVISNEGLIAESEKKGSYLMEKLKRLNGISGLRGKGLMIGFDVKGRLNELKNLLLNNYQVFTGEAKPDSIRLLPSLNISMEEIDLFIQKLKSALDELSESDIESLQKTKSLHLP